MEATANPDKPSLGKSKGVFSSIAPKPDPSQLDL
jgi:hypothetical protein